MLAANERTYEERLASLGLIASSDDPTPTVAGLLIVGRSPRTWVPGAYIQFLRVAGAAWGDRVVDEQEIDGTLDQMLTRVDDKLRATLTNAVDFTTATTEIRSSPYPLAALQQLVRNAVMHRTYEGTHAPVRVYWFDERVEVHSPGGPFGVVNATNFGKPGVSDYRNSVLAAALKTMGFGFGIAEARRALERNGNPPPEFAVEPTSVVATVRRASA